MRQQSGSGIRQKPVLPYSVSVGHSCDLIAYKPQLQVKSLCSRVDGGKSPVQILLECVSVIVGNDRVQLIAEGFVIPRVRRNAFPVKVQEVVYNSAAHDFKPKHFRRTEDVSFYDLFARVVQAAEPRALHEFMTV